MGIFFAWAHERVPFASFCCDALTQTHDFSWILNLEFYAQMIRMDKRWEKKDRETESVCTTEKDGDTTNETPNTNSGRFVIVSLAEAKTE